jgi:hypothetical protein
LDFAWLVKAIPIFTNPYVVTDPATKVSTTLVVPTLDSPYCPSGRPDCIHESRWAIHVTLGEAF